MAKNLKLNIKNTQIAQAINLGNLKKAISKNKDEPAKKESVAKAEEAAPVKGTKTPAVTPPVPPQATDETQEVQPRTKARSRSAFAEHQQAPEAVEPIEPIFKPEELPEETQAEEEVVVEQEAVEAPQEEPPVVVEETPIPEIQKETVRKPILPVKPQRSELMISTNLLAKKEHLFLKDLPVREKFGPTGKHVKDLLPKKPPAPPAPAPRAPRAEEPRPKPKTETAAPASTAPASPDKAKTGKFKEFRDLKPAKKVGGSTGSFDSRDSRGLRAGDEDSRWRKRKQKQVRYEEDTTIRPTSLKVRIPIAIKDLAVEMKLKASQLIQKLFLQGVIVTLNDLLDDETTIGLLGHEFGCEITIDTSEEERIRITDKSIDQEITDSDSENLTIRPPVVAFMGHVDHGKTSLIDFIRNTNRAAGEAGAITQHIGAFMCKTDVGDIAILDTPGHEAFSAMRERGANVTDIIVLVVAGDEGIRQQTIEAIHHAKTAGVTIVVAINKSDKPNFNAETIYRQLSEQDLLPEAWGGQTITINCSALTGEGVKDLLDMLALQAQILELKANVNSRARGSVIETEMHKGLGARTTVLVQNGTLKKGDALVFDHFWGRVKTMHNELNQSVDSAGPSHPVVITGLSGLPEAGQEFIVVKNEKEAKEISQKRTEGFKQNSMLFKKKLSMENMLELSDQGKKVLNVVIRADVQGSLEALKSALEKIKSTKAELNIVYTGVGEISESDVQLAAASKAVIIGFHTQIESHAETLVKEHGIVVNLHDIIYHAVDDVKALMKNLLDKLPIETETGKALVKATFKSSHLGTICGCQVTEGIINRNNRIRVIRGKETVFRGSIASLKKVKEDVREVPKGIECGILIQGFNDAEPDDIIEAYEITYLIQEL